MARHYSHTTVKTIFTCMLQDGELDFASVFNPNHPLQIFVYDDITSGRYSAHYFNRFFSASRLLDDT